MKKLFVLALALGVFLGGCQKDEIVQLPQDDAIVGLKNGDVIPNQFIVVYNPTTSLKSSLVGKYEDRVSAMRRFSEDIFSEVGIPAEAIQLAYSGTIEGVAARLSDEEVSLLKNDKRIAYIEPDRVVMLAKPGSTVTPPPAQVVPWGITRVGGFVAYTGTKKAWVIDTGIDYTHPDLNVNTTLSKTFVTRTTSANDDNGHGSHVAGTIAAIDNTIGVVGVAAGAQLVAVKVLDKRGSGAYSLVIAGVDYVAATAASGDVANMSLGGPISDALDAAVIAAANKGIKFALAAGNESQNANNCSPARVNHANVYTISAMSSTDVWASFSNYANPPVDYCAPGVSIYSTWMKGGYSTISGTSMASPHAAGVLMLGTPKADGYVIGDPDGTPDPIIHR
ncbi:MAG: S8 family serine peptidase [Tenuifilaceae bacterium]|jgi:subtilisin family serine protease|nr:S8 family serine peptidase [Tenuifilaceae bacterium]